MQTEITHRDTLLGPDGRLTRAGFSKRPVLDYDPAAVRVSRLPGVNRLRLKEWDYYGVTTPDWFFSLTVSHVGYMGLVFAYYIDFHQRVGVFKPLPTPLGLGVGPMPRTSEAGDVRFDLAGVSLHFRREPERRRLSCRWPRFHQGQTLEADLELVQPADMDSIVMMTPMGGPCFYYNHKVNCMPASGEVRLGDLHLTPRPDRALGNLDWGRGVWPYRSFWNWASASGFLADGRRLGLNLGSGFGDLSAATENCVFVDGVLHKLGWVDITYDPRDVMRPWTFRDDAGRLELTLTPIFDRAETTNLLVLASVVHQMFGRYDGRVATDDGESIEVAGVMGWAEEHRARW